LCAVLVAGCALERTGIVSLTDDAGQSFDARVEDSATPPIDSGDEQDAGRDAGSPLEIVAVAAGEAFSCALRSDGEVRCWGNNGEGQLGDGTLTSRATSARVNLAGPARQISAGDAHACAVLEHGALQCWGDNDDGQIGVGATSAQEPSPRDVAVAGVTFVAAGGLHTCAIHTGGQLACWGDNTFQQTGVGVEGRYTSPMTLQTIAGVAYVAASDRHTCAIGSNGLSCWGSDTDGRLGDGPIVTTGGFLPLSVDLPNATRIGLGADHSCALADGNVFCWGKGNEGRLGNGGTSSSPSPVRVEGIGGAVSVDGGTQHTCAVAGGVVLCWGRNDNNELGNPSDVNSSVPITVNLPDSSVTASAVSVGDEHVCALASGRVFCWGRDGSGQLGNDADGGGERDPIEVTDLL
jgi:alpha-tubulin suppressor-like RCC1 family protein